MQAYASGVSQNPPAKEPLKRYNVKNENNGVLNTFYEGNINNKSSRVLVSNKDFKPYLQFLEKQSEPPILLRGCWLSVYY
jgi:hypothetical protein